MTGILPFAGLALEVLNSLRIGIERISRQSMLFGVAILVVAFLDVWWISGDLFHHGIDEGIYLEGGRRVASSESPYVDFFALTGPLTFWIEGTLARLGGVNVTLMRLPVALDLAFLVWAVYWLALQFERAFFSAGLALMFLVYETKVTQLVVNHRWDSAALGTAAVLFAVSADRTGGRKMWMLSGCLAAAAAWATPTVLLVAVPLLLWSGRRGIGGVLSFLGGGAVVTLLAAGYLESRHALGPMIESMRWTSVNYAGANSVPYGFLGFAPSMPSNDRGLAERVATLAWSGWNALPAVLPPVAILGWAWRLWRRKDSGEQPRLILLLAATVAMVLSAWPRWSSMQLLFVDGLPFTLCGILFHRSLSARWRPGLYAGLILLTAGLGVQKAAAPLNYWSFSTRAGTMRGVMDDAGFLDPFERQIHTGDTLFVFPYHPVLYPLLNARNPTRYSFLQPGMMTAEDERKALTELAASQPHWVILGDFSREVVLSIWPGSDPARIPMEAMHDYLLTHYRETARVRETWGPLILMERIETPLPLP